MQTTKKKALVGIYENPPRIVGVLANNSFIAMFKLSGKWFSVLREGGLHFSAVEVPDVDARNQVDELMIDAPQEARDIAAKWFEPEGIST